MAKRIEMLGVSMETYSGKEIMDFMEEYVSNEELNVVCAITSYTLMAASEQEELRDFLNQSDLRIIADPMIYETSGERFQDQYVEIKRQELEEQMMRLLIRKRKRLFYLGETQEQLRRFTAYMGEHYPELSVAGMGIKGIEEGKVEHIINEINSADADVLLVHFHSPAQERFLQENKGLLHVRMCLCLGDGIRSRYGAGIRISRLKGLWDQTMFKRKVMRQETREE